jgi:sulfur carrier protein ThiS
MGNLTVVKNPFNSYDGRIYASIEEGTNLLDLIDVYRCDEFDIIVSLNGKILNEDELDVVLKKTDHLTLMAKIKGGGGESKGKTVLRIVALIVITIVSYGTLGPAAAGALGFSTTGVVAGLFGAAFAVAGAMLVNALIPPPKPELGNFEDKQDSNLYGWGPKQNQFNEGQTAAVVFGKTKVYPQIIGNYREFVAYKDNLNILFHLCDGKIDAVTDIKINDIPLAELGANVASTLLDGSLSQTAPKAFNDTIYEKAVSFELEEVSDEIIVQTDGNSVERLAVGMVFPGGVFDYDKGQYVERATRYSIEYRAVGSGTWLPFQTNHPDPGMDMSLTGKTRERIWYERQCTQINLKSESCVNVRMVGNVTDTFDTTGFTIYGNSPDTTRIIHEHDADLTPDQYEIRVIRLSKGSDTTASERQVVSFIQEKTLDDFNYPGRAILSLNAVAQEKIYGGRPVISCVVDKQNIEQYSGDWGVGSPTLRPGNSPAWACYEMLTHPLFGAGLHPDQIEIQDFIDWHTFCAANSLEVNIYIGQSARMNEALARVGFLGMGSVVQRGTKFGAAWDEASSKVHMFTMGNIIESTMKMAYIEKENRANTVEVTYYDKDIDYTRKTLVQKTDETISAGEERKAAIDMIGCVDRQQAIDYARFLLRSNEYLVRVVEFEADIDAVPVQPGDVFGVAHDVPLWGESGRSVSATSNTIVLDKEVTMETGKSYNVIVRNDTDDTFETQAIVNPGTGTYSSLTLTGTWTTIPPAKSLYTFGENTKEEKLFRCTSVQRSQDMRVKVFGLEYRSEVYVNDPSPLPDYEQEAFVDQLIALEVDDNYKVLPDGSIQGILNITWRGYAVYWDVRVSEKETGHTKPEWNQRVEQSHFDAIGIRQNVEYEIVVTSPNGTKLTLDYTPIIDPPEKVKNLVAGQIDNFVTIDWEPGDSEVPVYKYLIHKGPNYDTAAFIGESDKTFTTFYEISSGTYVYWVTPVTESGFLGDALSTTLDVPIAPDFKAITDFCVDGTGSHSNTAYAEEGVIGPVNTTETWDEWWDSVFPPSAAGKTWQDMIDLGYISLFAPNGTPVTTGQYIQTFDLGTEIGQGSVHFTVDRANLTPRGNTVDLTTTVEWSQDDISYTSIDSTKVANLNDFRYIKVTLDYASDGEQLIAAKPCFQVLARRVTEVGKGSITNATTGLTVSFDFDYYDVESIVVSPIGTTALFAVYDFNDVPNPTDFTVYLFDENGTKVTGNFAYTITGI